MNNLTISLVQGDTYWQDPQANRDYYQTLINRIKSATDIIVLPETFTGSFSHGAIDKIEDMQGPTVTWMQSMAKLHDAAITGSVQLKAPKNQAMGIYNRMLFVTPDGHVSHYDKRHLFRYANEHKRYAAGYERLLVNWRGWRIQPQICYDLRFPVWNRNHFVDGQADYDVMLFVANWPTPRRYAWRTLLRARAMENLSYCVGVNRVGVDANNHDYSGDSAIVDACGQTMLELGYQAQVASVELNFKKLEQYRAHFPAWMDADNFQLIID